MAGRPMIARVMSWPRFRVYALALLVCTLWGASFVLTKVALEELGPFAVAFGRWSLAVLVFALYLPLMGYTSEVRRALHERWRAFAWLGLVGICLFYVLQNFGLRFSTAVNVGLVINVTSIFIAILGVWWLGERLERHAVLGIVVSFVGVSLVSLQGGRLALGGRSWLGDGLTVLAALCAAVYSVYGKRVVAQYSPAVVTGLAALFGAVFLLPLAMWEGWTWPISVRAQGALWVLGFGSSALANLWWWKVLEQSDASRAGTYLFLIPIISTFLAVVFLGEPFTWMTALGAALVLGGVMLTQHQTV
ncbi:MAG: DMT family transporter [Chloroflexi bacterium]|nr:DMT family transporter [Chloroflexota bacterium]